jgi:hypothetical protein
MSEVEERFLRLPDSDDFTRVRQFKIDAKGAVVSRGDSFRRKRVASQNNSLSSGRKSKSTLYLQTLNQSNIQMKTVHLLSRSVILKTNPNRNPAPTLWGRRIYQLSNHPKTQLIQTSHQPHILVTR